MNIQTNPNRRGLAFILSSPSGAGKSTLSRKLLNIEADISLSISVTTRPRRASEVDGVDYFFVTTEKFKRMRDGGELLEWAEVHGNLYATPRAAVEEALADGRDVLFDIDWQGTRQIAEAMPNDVVRLFILPPSMSELKARLERRAEDGPVVIAQRLDNAREEIGHWQEYEYVFVNDDLQRSVDIVRAVLRAERERRTRQSALPDFVAGLLAESF
jgi:guanylate kinase